MPTKPMDQKIRIQRSTEIDPESGCWNWILSRDRLGYGRLKVSMGSRDAFRTESAHRYSFEIFSGEIPDGKCVLHRCDNRACCNPDHLFIGAQQDNMNDMHAKGRGPKGYSRDPHVCSKNAKNKINHRNQHSRAIDTAMEQAKC